MPAVTWLERIMEATPRLPSPPKPFGAFHLTALGLTLGLFILMMLFRKRLPRSDKAVHTILAVFAFGLLLLEVGKQIVCSYDPSNGWAYNWERFPFQFCSVPIYVALIATFLPKGKVRQALLCFLATYSPVAGASVLFYPARSVFSEIIFLDVHTMVWHGAMLLFGLYLWLSGAVKAEWKTAGYAALVYVPLNFIALALNEASYAFGFAAGYDFNMFYTGRLGRCLIPVLSTIQKTCPYPVFFVSYLLTLGVGGLLVTTVMVGIRWLWKKRR
ncbi:MAG: YwaF family protein [Clostridia bacterium]|nr:YwaF family protein [Clostridia bacterium]